MRRLAHHHLSGIITLVLVLMAVFLAQASRASGPSKWSFSGYLVYDAKAKVAWYAEPTTGYRYAVTTTSAWKKIASRVASPLADDDFAAIPVAGTTEEGNIALRQRWSGRIIATATTPGAYWYVIPSTKQKVSVDASNAVVSLAKTSGKSYSSTFASLWPKDPGVQSGSTAVRTSRGTFTVKYVKVNRVNPDYRFMTDNISPGLGMCMWGSCGCSGSCPKNYSSYCPKCTTQAFSRYVQNRRAVAAINGTYFRTPPYYTTELYSSLYAVQNSFAPSQHFYRNPWDVQAEVTIVDTSNRVFFHVTNPQCPYEIVDDYKSDYTTCLKDSFRPISIAAGGTGTIQALFGTDSLLVLRGKNVASTYHLDAKQKTAKSSRGFFGQRGNTLYFAVVYGATIPDAGMVAAAMKLDYAANLDGGGSSALYANGKYLVGPGRSIPNALLITK